MVGAFVMFNVVIPTYFIVPIVGFFSLFFSLAFLHSSSTSTYQVQGMGVLGDYHMECRGKVLDIHTYICSYVFD